MDRTNLLAKIGLALVLAFAWFPIIVGIILNPLVALLNKLNIQTDQCLPGSFLSQVAPAVNDFSAFFIAGFCLSFLGLLFSLLALIFALIKKQSIKLQSWSIIIFLLFSIPFSFIMLVSSNERGHQRASYRQALAAFSGLRTAAEMDFDESFSGSYGLPASNCQTANSLFTAGKNVLPLIKSLEDNSRVVKSVQCFSSSDDYAISVLLENVGEKQTLCDPTKSTREYKCVDSTGALENIKGPIKGPSCDSI